MSLRRGAIRERLRRGADRMPGTLYVDECEDGSTKVRARRGITSSLSPPRQRGSECKYSSPAGLEREEIVHLKAFPKDLSAALASSPLFKDAKFHKDIAMARAGEGARELQEWKRAAPRIPVETSLSSGAELSSFGGLLNDRDSENDDTCSLESFRSGTSFGSVRRLPVSERASMQWVASTTAVIRTGAVPTEFTCVALGFFMLILTTYLAQYALRHGYIQPPE
mmetsp:Transcript_18697/g.35619  ORF Transcript_18697/g.35619 Transcript_18697/m.35619 type:complete len:224 (-) Transcript_18697:362-1033(-)|eukprot:CAMPEP_0114228088 /NCGR_PEP_ID=MMETSP0058-20121206/2150_1 /TAXON_ID=36894 /ORGANISM="Pyramimonas parkeae, CCMP726" /LENGTH=223 /DNA_ID=CAMNT_0001338999 /DNA_START=192 /DNA_END=866 /DNA_ORIENTATION=+